MTTLLAAIEDSIPLPANATEAMPELTDLEEIQMRGRTVKLIADIQGVPIEPSADARAQATQLANQVMSNPETKLNLSVYPNETMAYLAGMVGAYQADLVKEFADLKRFVINKLINKYLAAMDFFVKFELDESFNETIKSRHRDEFTYDSFSEGEKQRIDLALMLTFRSVAKMKNTCNTNLVIMDEVFDSSLDHNGTDYLMDLLNTLGSETNVFVISHKGDILFDKFRSVIKFEKHQNFSRIARG
jgi:hypothetical protein